MGKDQAGRVTDGRKCMDGSHHVGAFRRRAGRALPQKSPIKRRDKVLVFQARKTKPG